MINERMRDLGRRRSAIRDIFEYGLLRKRELGEEAVYDFSLGNPSVPPPEAVNRELLRIIEELPSVTLHGYTSAAGDLSVREAVAGYLSKTHGMEVFANELYMTVGAAAALTCALNALVQRGEEVILLSPYFPEYRVFAEGAGASVVEVECRKNDFHPDTSAIKKAINEKTAAIIVNSPNNPTGAVYTEAELSELSEILLDAQKEYGHPIYLIADEPYRELVFGGARVPFIPRLYHNTVVCYSFSKSLSIPGERIGFALVPKNVTNRTDVYNAIAGAGRSLGYVCAPSLLQRLLPAVLGMTSELSVYDENRRLLFSALSKMGFSVVPPEGAFYMFLRSPIENAAEFCLAARKYELLLVPSDSFGVSGYVRISYCVDTEMIKRSLPAFGALAKEFGLNGD
ncbi:MAG: pyridoxal phosphate-dependent aminotransferase [Clostridia bacterium]|nr:pyridoxal phosphate-dependent aminotransferase [Clostridia bacterium]